MRSGFADASANNDVDLTPAATVAPAAAESLRKWRRVVLLTIKHTPISWFLRKERNKNYPTARLAAPESVEQSMKKKLILFLAVLLTVCVAPNPSAKAIDVSISIGDRPYYYGPNYWDNGYYWVWVPGYHHGHNWVHGHYERRGNSIVNTLTSTTTTIIITIRIVRA